MTSIWVVEDDPEYQALYAFLLEREGMRVDCFADGKAALDALGTARPDLLLVDLGLPGMSGLAILQALRVDPRLASIPVVVATGSGQAADKYRSLDLADDFLTKPFDPVELVLRVKARLRGTGTGPAAADALEVSGVRLEFALHEVEVAGRRHALTPSEFAILKYLMERPGRPASVETLLTVALDYPPGTGNPDALRNHVRSLRLKIEADPGSPELVLNVPRIGYMFKGGGSNRES